MTTSEKTYLKYLILASDNEWWAHTQYWSNPVHMHKVATSQKWTQTVYLYNLEQALSKINNYETSEDTAHRES